MELTPLAFPGVTYAVPKGLIATLGNGSVNLTADLRNDPALIAALESSSDLVSWNPLSWSAVADQTGVALGFVRYNVQDPTRNPQSFYHLRLNY